MQRRTPLNAALAVIAATTIAWGATAIILFSATYLQKWLGTRVLTAIERLMGMVIVAISVQMLLDGIASYLRAGT